MKNIIDKNIVINKDKHEYRLLLQPDMTFTSVTTFVEQFFEGFNAVKVAKKLIRKYHRYKNRTVESLVEEWKSSAEYGTKVHQEIEKWILDGIEPKDIKAINGKKWLENYKLKSEIEIYPEVIIYSTELTIAGTIDIIAKDNNTGSYELIDWKTSKKIDKVSYGYKMGIHEVTKNILDCNFYHYALQLSLYRYILEQYYGISINNQLIVHLQDDKVNALVAPYMRNEIISMLNSCGLQ
tara:strand:- start:729 stop:1442 length:714 start_codon:yes stop_codon:yes gene_type:complete